MNELRSWYSQFTIKSFMAFLTTVVLFLVMNPDVAPKIAAFLHLSAGVTSGFLFVLGLISSFITWNSRAMKEIPLGTTNKQEDDIKHLVVIEKSLNPGKESKILPEESKKL